MKIDIVSESLPTRNVLAETPGRADKGNAGAMAARRTAASSFDEASDEL